MSSSFAGGSGLTLHVAGLALGLLVITVDVRQVAGQLARPNRAQVLTASAALVAGLVAYAGPWRS